MKERTLQNKAEERKPRTRLTKWLAKIAGKYDGELEPKTEAEFYLNEIAENSGGGGSVPTPTIEDAGKAIVVNDSGEYALDNVGGGMLVVTFDDNTLTLNKTWNEIHSALLAGVFVIIQMLIDDDIGIYYLSQCTVMNNDDYHVECYQGQPSQNPPLGQLTYYIFRARTTDGVLTLVTD